MSNALLARFPLGVYQGHQADGRPEVLPQLTRVFAALVNSACRGGTAVDGGDDLRPTAEAIAALRWLEDNSPDGLVIPRHRSTAERATTSYRREGVFESTGEDRTVGKSVGLATALPAQDDLAWVWTQEIPDDIARTLDDLCADVGYLGESDSPVVMRVGETTRTHRRSDSSPFASGLTAVQVPTQGRLAALDGAYRRARPTKLPSIAADKHAMTARPTPSEPVGHVATTVVRYSPVSPEPTRAPWTTVYPMIIDGVVESRDRVSWCVALHRALAARLGDAAPAVITGAYRTGVRQPANRVAIQIVEPSSNQADELPGTVFAVMLPADIEPDDVIALERALSGLRRVYRNRAQEIAVTAADPIDASRFWRAPTDGMTRLWRSVRPLVAETRRQVSGEGKPWTLADAAVLSVAFTGRDDLDDASAERGARRYAALAAAARQCGVRATEPRVVADSHVGRYAHKLPNSVVAQAFDVTLDLGNLWDPRALVAVGQSRHLGGGLLAPFDVTPEMAQSWFLP